MLSLPIRTSKPTKSEVRPYRSNCFSISTPLCIERHVARADVFPRLHRYVLPLKVHLRKDKLTPKNTSVPPVFAKKLTYPEPCTNHNFYELKEAVLNGVDKWPGAAAIENENGQVINLRTKNFEERQALANQLLAPSNTSVTGARNKKVHRHLNNGDIVLMNRQPTLHKPSIMAHRARVLPGEKTIRMHYANCNTYNADFDGDEMNMHFPQNEIARAEALQIADTDHQYLSATAGKPLRGLIQDHISMGVWLTNRDTLFDREDYHQLLYGCLYVSFLRIFFLFYSPIRVQRHIWEQDGCTYPPSTLHDSEFACKEEN